MSEHERKRLDDVKIFSLIKIVGPFVLAVSGLIGGYYVMAANVKEDHVSVKDHEKRITVLETELKNSLDSINGSLKDIKETQGRLWQRIK